MNKYNKKDNIGKVFKKKYLLCNLNFNKNNNNKIN